MLGSIIRERHAEIAHALSSSEAYREPKQDSRLGVFFTGLALLGTTKERASEKQGFDGANEMPGRVRFRNIPSSPNPTRIVGQYLSAAKMFTTAVPDRDGRSLVILRLQSDRIQSQVQVRAPAFHRRCPRVDRNLGSAGLQSYGLYSL